VIHHNCSPLHNKPPFQFSQLAAITVGKLYALVSQKQFDRVDQHTNIMVGILGSSCEVICIDQNSEQTILRCLEDEEGYYVDKCEQDFAILNEIQF
jgi:hypothetical protein